jgi:PadR family transcriptional regulator, regulatory protein PadR
MPSVFKADVLPGTLEMLVLVTLRREPLHGYAIAQRIQQDSGDLLRAEEGSLYPALQRLLIQGWVTAKWGISSHNRRVRLYTLTASGRKQLRRELERVRLAIEGIGRIIRPCES